MDFSELSRRLGAIPDRLMVADAADASISSSSLDAMDSSLPTAPIAVATSAHPAVSDSSTTVAADQDNLLIVLDGTTSSCYTRSLENSEHDSFASCVKQTFSTNTEQTSLPQPAPVPRPRKSKQVTQPKPSDLTQLSASVTSSQKQPADLFLQSSSVTVSSAPLQSVQEARALFIQSTTPPILKVNPRQSSLDQFDPLASGQLVVDGQSSENTSIAESVEENLLKEWDLNFSQSTSGPRLVGPAVTLQPRVMVPPSTVYASMPNLGPGSVRYPGYRIVYPSQPVQPWTMNHGVRHQSSASMLTPNRAMDGTNKCATLPSGVASVPQLSSSEIGGSTTNATGSSTASDPSLDWTANIDVLLRPHSMDLSSFASTLSNSHQSSASQMWEKFE